MKESVTYQAIVEAGKIEGRIEGHQEFIRRVGSKRFGPPDAPTLAAVSAIRDLDRLDRLVDRLLDVSSWDELLRTP